MDGPKIFESMIFGKDENHCVVTVAPTRVNRNGSWFVNHYEIRVNVDYFNLFRAHRNFVSMYNICKEIIVFEFVIHTNFFIVDSQCSCPYATVILFPGMSPEFSCKNVQNCFTNPTSLKCEG
eukprot:TRINITY_DN65436_c0_g1_i1.p2 TRINITY_DN65436_c0_g1~~TRINITY_DN65436_c0_g1_i1.p2  ORF type:complete len:122 (+),score=5.93 TRINITY_DN65436_c0_g1_i1:115-480(+)